MTIVFGIEFGEMGQHFHATRLGHHQVVDADIVAGLSGPVKASAALEAQCTPYPSCSSRSLMSSRLPWNRPPTVFGKAVTLTWVLN